MRASTLFLVVAAAMTMALVNAQDQPDTALPCYEASCTPLIDILKGCSIDVDPTTGNINFPVATAASGNTTAQTDQCLCKQPIVNAYDPCYTCGLTNNKIQDKFSTQKLVDSCNLQFGAKTVTMPGAAAGAARAASTLGLAVLAMAVSVVVMA